jgi:hypothetical protein
MRSPLESRLNLGVREYSDSLPEVDLDRPSRFLTHFSDERHGRDGL